MTNISAGHNLIPTAYSSLVSNLLNCLVISLEDRRGMEIDVGEEESGGLNYRDSRWLCGVNYTSVKA